MITLTPRQVSACRSESLRKNKRDSSAPKRKQYWRKQLNKSWAATPVVKLAQEATATETNTKNTFVLNTMHSHCNQADIDWRNWNFVNPQVPPELTSKIPKRETSETATGDDKSYDNIDDAGR